MAGDIFAYARARHLRAANNGGARALARVQGLTDRFTSLLTLPAPAARYVRPDPAWPVARPSPAEWSEAKFEALCATLPEAHDDPVDAACIELAAEWTLPAEAADPVEPAPELE